MPVTSSGSPTIEPRKHDVNVFGELAGAKGMATRPRPEERTWLSGLPHRPLALEKQNTFEKEGRKSVFGLCLPRCPPDPGKKRGAGKVGEKRWECALGSVNFDQLCASLLSIDR